MSLLPRPRKAKNAPDDLLDGSGRACFFEAAQNVSERAIPFLTEFLNRDDNAYRTLGGFDLVGRRQFVEGADGDLHLILSDAELAHQSVAQRLAQVDTLRLNEEDRPQILAGHLRF